MKFSAGSPVPQLHGGTRPYHDASWNWGIARDPNYPRHGLIARTLLAQLNRTFSLGCGSDVSGGWARTRGLVEGAGGPEGGAGGPEGGAGGPEGGAGGPGLPLQLPAAPPPKEAPLGATLGNGVGAM